MLSYKKLVSSSGTIPIVSRIAIPKTRNLNLDSRYLESIENAPNTASRIKFGSMYSGLHSENMSFSSLIINALRK